MKICIDIRPLMDKYYSGVSLYTLSLVSELLKLDKDNKYTLFYNSLKDYSGRIPKINNAKYLQTRFPSKILDYFSFNILNRPRIDRLSGADVLLVPHLNFIATSKLAKKILTIHDLSMLRYPEFFGWKKNIWHWSLRIRSLVRRFDVIVAVSESTKRDIIELLDVVPEKVKVIYPGVSDIYRKDVSQRQMDKLKKKYKLPDKFILFLGTIEPRKNIETLVRAFEILHVTHPDVYLVLSGIFGWKSAKSIRKIKISESKDAILSLGYIPEEEKPALYRLAKVFVYPSFYEGFGFPPVEAMASGVPVVTSFSSSLIEMAGGAAIMADPYDANSIANAIESLLNNNKLRDLYIEKGLVNAQKFDWQKTAIEYLKLFK